MNDKEKLDMLLEAVEAIFPDDSFPADTSKLGFLRKAFEAYREPEKPRVSYLSFHKEGNSWGHKDSVLHVPAIELTDEVRRRLGKDAGVSGDKLYEICNDPEMWAGDKACMIMNLVAAASVEVDDV